MAALALSLSKRFSSARLASPGAMAGRPCSAMASLEAISNCQQQRVFAAIHLGGDDDAGLGEGGAKQVGLDHPGGLRNLRRDQRIPLRAVVSKRDVVALCGEA